MEATMTEMMVDLQEAYQGAMAKKKPSIKNFLRECVESNKEEIIRSLKNMHQFETVFILETFCYQLLAGMFREKEKEDLLTLVSSGGIFKIKDELLNEFYNDQDISQLLI